MIIPRSHKRWLILISMMVVFIAACQNGDDNDGTMTLQDEHWEDVIIAPKDRPTLLFHFTSAG